jgi:nitrite reductase (NADH) small subunit
MPQLVRVADVKDVPEGRCTLCRVRGREIALWREGEIFYAVKNSCPHQGMPLERGRLEAGVLTCPAHGWQFDLTTGNALNRAPGGLRRYRVQILADQVWIEFP